MKSGSEKETLKKKFSIKRNKKIYKPNIKLKIKYIYNKINIHMLIHYTVLGHSAILCHYWTQNIRQTGWSL